MSNQTEIDKKLIKDLIEHKNVDKFVNKYQGLIFSVIDKQIQALDPTSKMTPSLKKKMMMDFIDNLLSDNAQLLHNYFRPQRINSEETEAKSQDLPSLDIWLHRQCVNFFSARFIIDGILSRNINIIQNFFFNDKRPGCRELFSRWIFENNVYSDDNATIQKHIDRIIQEYVNVLYVEVDPYLDEQSEISEGKRKRRRKKKDYENAELTTIARFKFKGNFYSYFRDYVIHPYLKRKFFNSNNPTISIDDDSREEGNGQSLEIISPVELPYDNDAKELLEKIFQIMERTDAGRRQVEVLKKSYLESDMPSDEIIANTMNLSVSNLRKIRSEGKDMARKIAKKIDIN